MWIRIGIKDTNYSIKEIGPFNLEEKEIERLKTDLTNYLRNQPRIQAGGIYHYLGSELGDGVLFLKFEEIAYIS
jgi:hypothetical protein